MGYGRAIPYSNLRTVSYGRIAKLERVRLTRWGLGVGSGTQIYAVIVENF